MPFFAKSAGRPISATLLILLTLACWPDAARAANDITAVDGATSYIDGASNYNIYGGTNLNIYDGARVTGNIIAGDKNTAGLIIENNIIGGSNNTLEDNTHYANIVGGDSNTLGANASYNLVSGAYNTVSGDYNMVSGHSNVTNGYGYDN